MNPLVEIKNLTKRFKFQDKQITAVNDLSFAIHKGEILGLAGESGCGKSTVGKCLLHLIEPTSGSLYFDGELIRKASFQLRKKMQMIFQDPYSSLNPMMTIGQIIGEPLAIHAVFSSEKRLERVAELLHQVGLQSKDSLRYPHEFSGGQRQRIGIARALALEPEFLICDEPISALDATIQRQIVDLMRSIQAAKNLTYLWISHDLSVMENFAHRIAVMYLGKLMEVGPAQEVFRNPIHPYTQALSSAIPIPDPKAERARTKIILYGEAPSSSNPPNGCVFHTRCPLAQPICKTISPVLKEVTPNRFSACHFDDL